MRLKLFVIHPDCSVGQSESLLLIMDAHHSHHQESDPDRSWMEQVHWSDLSQASLYADRMETLIEAHSNWQSFCQLLGEQLAKTFEPNHALSHLIRFLEASESPQWWIEQFVQHPEHLSSLLLLMSMSETLSNRLITDGDLYRWILDSQGVPRSREELVQELSEAFNGIDQLSRASALLHRFYIQQSTRVAYAEFVGGLSPEKVGRYLSAIADAMIEVGLQFVMRRLVDRRGEPQRPDGSVAEVTVLGVANLGGNEMSYNSPLKLVFIYDSIDNHNVWHRDFYNTLVDELVGLLRGDPTRTIGLDVDLREGPRSEVGVHICSFREAIRIYETAGRTSQRLDFVKARVVAGSVDLGNALLARLESWIYQQFMSRVELSETRTIRRKLEKRIEQKSLLMSDLTDTSGGKHDLELTIQFLQLLHGGGIPEVRKANTYEAVGSLQRSGCLTHQESTLFSESYARLGRLQNQIALMFDRSGKSLPDREDDQRRLAWYLGIKEPDTDRGDLIRFQKLLNDTFDTNRSAINHLMLDAPDKAQDVSVETELLLDPDPDVGLIDKVAAKHGLSNATRMMEHLHSLSMENVSFLSPHRCRHFFALIAPALLEAISKTPSPDETLSSLVRVTDSLGAKATLWELMSSSPPTMNLMVRLCAATPYLVGILINSPGMIDELVDSLMMNRLPTTARLDSHSIELCRGAVEIELILQSFKSSSHLMIGVRDILGKDTLENIHQAIGDTAESCLRRVADYEQESLAMQFGDPVDDRGDRSELVMLALGKLGAREPNYHSDLDAVFLYATDGETQRRPGGHRATLTNQQFFNQMARKIIDRVNDSSGLPRLYKLDSRLRDSGEEGMWAMRVESFFSRFEAQEVPLWQWLALCKARAISGSHALRSRIDERIHETLCLVQWRPEMASEIREMRLRMEQTARPENLKRGIGGTVDVELISQALTLRHLKEFPQVHRVGTTESLTALVNAGCIESNQAQALIDSYRYLRRVEGNLRLMNTVARHEIPEETQQQELLAFLMNERDYQLVIDRCNEIKIQNRRVFDQVFDALAIESIA